MYTYPNDLLWTHYQVGSKRNLTSRKRLHVDMQAAARFDAETQIGELHKDFQLDVLTPSLMSTYSGFAASVLKDDGSTPP